MVICHIFAGMSSEYNGNRLMEYNGNTMAITNSNWVTITIIMPYIMPMAIITGVYNGNVGI